MQDSGVKAIKVTPDELSFESLVPNVEQTQELVFRNNLSTPIDITLKSSNTERIQIEPKQKRLAPFESFTAEVTAKISKSSSTHKALKYKEVIKIQNDFFDQKVNVMLIPGIETSRSRDNSLQASQVRFSKGTRQQSKSPLKLVKTDESDQRESVIEELSTQLKQAEADVKAVQTLLQIEQAKVKDFESRPEGSSTTEYLEKVKVLLREREPNLEKLMEVTLRKERDTQEHKDAKILEMLKSKDRQIEELQSRTVSQETEYGKLATAFQEQNRRIKSLEEQESELEGVVTDLEGRLDQSHSRLDSFEKGKEYRRLLESEERLQEATQYIAQIQNEFESVKESLQQKENIEVYCEEVIQRYKDQMHERDAKLVAIQRDFESEKEKRIREEEHVKTLTVQLNNESSLKASNDTFERINRLQTEKSEFLSQIENLSRERFHIEDQLRTIIDHLSEVTTTPAQGGKSVMDTLIRRIDDLVNHVKSVDIDHKNLTVTSKELRDNHAAQEVDLQSVISDNKKLSQQIHEMLSKKVLSRPVQTEVDCDDIDLFEELKDKCASLEDINEELSSKLKQRDKQQNLMQAQLENKTQELVLHMRSDFSSHQTSSDNHQVSTDTVPRLNARISQLKINEDILVQELSKLRNLSESVKPSSKLVEQKMNEYESIVYEQRDQLIKLEEENAALRKQVREGVTLSSQQIEQLQVRLRNLQEVNKKHESLSMSQGSKPLEGERMRQALQDYELQIMTFKHQIDELKLENNQLSSELKNQKQDHTVTESALIKLRQDAKLSGLTQSSVSDQQLTGKLIDQRKQIKHLQGLLIRAKQDFDQISNSGGSYQIESTSKTNDRLRREHHQAIMAVVDLKEEFSSKMMIIEDKHEQIRQKLMNENSSVSRKLEAMQAQLSHLENKEVRLFGQLEEAKVLQVRESQEREQRNRELEDLLLRKESTTADLEREIRTKDKTLMERQEQISVLIGTLEGEKSRDEQRQKVLNLSAELCSVRAIESQQVRKLNDMTYHLKKVELQSTKHIKTLDHLKLENKELSHNLEQVKSENSILQRNIQDLTIQLDESGKETSDLRYKVEKDEFQLKIKDENIQQTRDQLKRAENQFKEEVDRLRKDFYEQISREYDHQKQQTKLDSNSIAFKAALQHIHISLCDLNANTDPHNSVLIGDFERAITVAASSIEKLQGELDRAHFFSARFKQDLKAIVLNKILLSRQEQLHESLNKFQSSQQQREEERAQYQRDQETSWRKIFREQEIKIQHLGQQSRESDDENQTLREDLRLTRDQKDELESSLLLFEHEIESKRQAMEKQAELSVDERFKAKHEAIKCYFDSQITRILLNSGSSNISSGSDRVLELSREILSLKLLVSKLESSLVCEQSETQAVELTLAHYKEQYSVQEHKIRDLSSKNAQFGSKSFQHDVSTRMESEKRKQDLVNLEKEQIKLRDTLEGKSRELSDHLSKREDQYKSGKSVNHELESAEKDNSIKHQAQQIEELQEKLLEIRSSHIQELDLLRVEYESEIAESKRVLHKEQEVLEKRYMPGHAPGEIQEENQELVRRLQDLKSGLDQVIQENALIRKKLDNERQMSDSLNREVDGYKQALVELESTMIDMGGQPPQVASRESYRDRSGGSRGRQTVASEKKQKKTHSKNPSKKLSLLRESQVDDSLATSVITQEPPKQSVNNAKQFVINPPAIVRALVSSKIQEFLIMRKYDDLLQVEVELRHNLKVSKLKEISNYDSLRTQDDMGEDQINLQRRIIELEVENEDLKIQSAHQQIDQIRSQHSNDRVDYPQQDYSIMIDALLSLTNQLALLEGGYNNREQMLPEMSQIAIEEAQRLVIRALSSKVYSEGDSEQYYQPPCEQQDRKLWYLELLEQQVNTSETVTNTLQSFIKKLSIDIQGNLQSAASIKSASMDLANNLKRTSDEVKTLKHIIGLAKHDLAKVTFTQPSQKTINPFASSGHDTARNQLQQMQQSSSQNSTQSVYNQLMSQQDQIQNSLTISEKVKKSLEEEIVSLKIFHSQELQSITHQLTQAYDQRNSMLQSNEDLHERVDKLQQRLDELKGETLKLNEQNDQTQATLIEKEREKQLLAQNKSATSKHLQKLQTDMQEWRRQTDDNMNIKEKQIEEFKGQLSTLQKERDRLKSENLMLRRVEKDRRSGEYDELKVLSDQNKELNERFQEQLNERKQEIEFWVSERATMRDMIEQLETEKVAVNEVVLPNSERHLKKKNQKKIKAKEVEIQTKERQIEDMRNEIHRARQVETQLDQRLREANALLQETEERLKYSLQKLREVELERDLVLAEKNNAISSNDVSAQHIQEELNSLRECFAKLKIERDNLLYEMETTTDREREWRQTVESLSEEVHKLEQQISIREKDQGSTFRNLDAKHQAVVQDLKMARAENEKVKEKLKVADSQQMIYEQKIHTIDMQAQEALYGQEELRRQVSEARSCLKMREQEVSELQEQQLIMEANKVREIEGLQSKVEEVRESNGHLAQLYDNQIMDLKSRFITDKKKTEHQADQIINLAQREAVIKSLKKELTVMKVSLNKVKSKNKEIKMQLNLEKENVSISSNTTKHSTSRKTRPSSNNSRYCNSEDMDKSVIKLAQILLGADDKSSQQSKNICFLETLQRYSKNAGRILILEAELEKHATLQLIAKDQVSDMRAANEDLQVQLDDLSQRLSTMQREGKSVGGQTAKSLMEQLEAVKSQLRQSNSDLSTLRQEWLPPSDARSLQERTREAQAQSKNLKEELTRKKEVIQQLKAFKEKSENEAQDVAADIEGLKDDNSKMQKLIKDNAKQLGLVKELKATNDQLRSTERRLREEVVALSERLRSSKADVTRKESLARDLKEKVDQISDETADFRERYAEIDRLKEMNKKLKLESEIKENQVRSLKVKIDHYEGECENLKKSQKDEAAEHQLETQLRAAKTKLKKSEGLVKKSVEALRKIGRQIVTAFQSRSSHKQQQQEKPKATTVQNNQYYKDSVNILGMSMDELLDDFVAPNSNVVSTKQGLEQQLIVQLDKLQSNADDDTVDLVCNLCLKLLNEF